MCVCARARQTVPVAGDIAESAVGAIMMDVAALSLRLNRKPLTIRLMPVPGKQAGDMTCFTSPYLCNTTVLDVAPVGAPLHGAAAHGRIAVPPLEKKPSASTRPV